MCLFSVLPVDIQLVQHHLFFTIAFLNQLFHYWNNTHLAIVYFFVLLDLIC